LIRSYKSVPSKNSYKRVKCNVYHLRNWFYGKNDGIRAFLTIYEGVYFSSLFVSIAHYFYNMRGVLGDKK
jgi:hypothetical protein